MDRLDALGARMEPPALRRGVGSPALFGVVQGLIAASIYFSLGLVAQRALGLTALTYLLAGVFFVLCVMTYVEGASLHQERGGATVFARYAFNELWSFVAGWAVLLDALILIAITAFTASNYLGVFWGGLDDGVVDTLIAVAVIAYVAAVQVVGPTARRLERIGLLVVADLVVQTLVVALGVVLVLDAESLTSPMEMGGTPELGDVVFAFTLAAGAFIGLDASSGLSGEVAIGRRGLRRLVTARTAGIIVSYVGIALIALSALPVGTLGRDEVEAPVLAVVSAYEPGWVGDGLGYAVGTSAFVVLVAACSAAMLGLSRLTFSLATNRQIPSALGRLHPRRSTPVVAIVSAALLAGALVVPGDLEFLAGLYAFGAMLAFTLAHASVCVLRFREPDRPRPYRMPFNLRLRGGSLPLPAALGAVVSFAAWVSVIVLHDGARLLGLLWMAGGVVLYVVYRSSESKPIFRRVTIPREALARPEVPDVEYGSILVPILGAELDVDIMQTAGRLARAERTDDNTDGPEIDALWVFEMPMSVPLTARVPDEQLKRARAALAKAKRVGEEYDRVKVSTAIVRARRTGEAIVTEARRRGVEAIVLAAEEPSRVRGGALLGGRGGPLDSFLGDVTKYVVEHAPCRVILTAPPARERTPAPPRPNQAPAAPAQGA